MKEQRRLRRPQNGKNAEAQPAPERPPAEVTAQETIQSPLVATEQLEEVPRWTYSDFLKDCELNDNVLKELELSWIELARIYDDHVVRTETLNRTATYVSEVLRKIPSVHSVRVRVKNPAHLIRKIVRKRMEDKTRIITLDNYQKEISDLIGIRALHLYKEEWMVIHSGILKEWKLVEKKPTAYVRKGDRPDWLDQYKKNGCKVKVHPSSYRSIHYVVKSAPSKDPVIVEIQVRTLFEEAWSEIDHKINYPDRAPFESVVFFLDIFNRLAGAADEMGTLLGLFVKDLSNLESELIKASHERDDTRRERDDAQREFNEAVAKLGINKTKQQELQQKIARVFSEEMNTEKKVAETISKAASLQPGIISSILGPQAAMRLMGITLSNIKTPCKHCGRSPLFGTLDEEGVCATCRMLGLK